MSIIVTPGETALIKEFNDRNTEIVIENLLVGDVHIRKGSSTIYIFERKAKGDLDASIKDGRYHEQKARLIETGLDRKNIIYIIEQLSKPHGTPASKRIWSAICNSQHRDGFTVFQTRNIGETADYLIGMSASVNKFNKDEPCESTGDVNVNIKKYQVSSNDWFKYSLTLIPRVSINIASVITANYPTLSALISVIEGSGACINCLADLKHGNSQRRVGKTLSQQICNTIIENY